jgi:uncharacterized membrane protein YgdD (TMEM256/DUF423 family)
MNIKLLKIAALSGGLAVAFGAFGAHTLRDSLDLAQMTTFKTGNLYHFIHTLAMLVLAFSTLRDEITVRRSFYLFLAGIILFSGSLYILSTKHLYGDNFWNFVGPLTPIGGVLLIAGWLNLFLLKEKNTYNQ